MPSDSAKCVGSWKSSLVNMEIQCKLCLKKKDEFQKVMSLAILGGLPTASHSLALSHYWPTQRLLAAGFPLWPGPPRLRQPDPPWLPAEVHVYAGLSADAGSTWTDGLKPVHFFRAKESLLIRCISCVCLSRSPVILVFIITIYISCLSGRGKKRQG